LKKDKITDFIEQKNEIDSELKKKIMKILVKDK